MNLNHWLVRAGIVSALTWAAYRFLPVGTVGKTIILSVGGVSVAGIAAANVPLVGMAVTGTLPQSTSTPTT